MPRTRDEFLCPFTSVVACSIRVPGKLCDLTVCHDRSSDTIPACLAATIIHGLEGFQEHEVGDVDMSQMDRWLALAAKHEFEFVDCAPAQRSQPQQRKRSPDATELQEGTPGKRFRLRGS